MTLVMKFGGTSVGSAQAIRETAELITQTKKEWHRVVVVASAMGSKPVKVTDLLLNGAYAAAAGDDKTYLDIAHQLHRIHQEAITGLLTNEQDAVTNEINGFLDHYKALCQAVQVLGELSNRALDTISGMGERLSVRILAAYLREQGHPAQAVDATNLIVTDSRYQEASPLLAETAVRTREQLIPLLEADIIPIVTGFIGADQNGVQTTLGRGGSDYSGAILGQVLEASEVWIWTDVDGVMTADPRLVTNARSIPTLSFREVSELAFFGARVLHPKTMRPCMDSDIPLRIKNTFNPNHPGTVIVPKLDVKVGGIKAVTAIKNLCLITVEGKGMLGIPGIAARTFGAVAEMHKNVLLISQASSEQSICFAAPNDSAVVLLEALNKEFTKELARRDIDAIWAQDPVSIVTVVGAGMRGTPGIAGQVFSALGESEVNIVAIAQGSSECSISIVVEQTEEATAVSCIHQLINRSPETPK